MNDKQAIDKPWPKKKRFLTTVGVTVMILLIAVVIGSGLYGLGRLAGIFQSKEEEIEEEVKETILADEAFVAEFMAALETSECVNTDMGFGLTVDDALEPTLTTAEWQCTDYRVVIDDEEYGLVKVSKQDISKDQALDEYLSQMSEAYVDSFPHQKYESALLFGDKEATPFLAVFYGTGENSSWRLVYYPVSPIYEQAFFNVAKSFRLL